MLTATFRLRQSELHGDLQRLKPCLFIGRKAWVRLHEIGNPTAFCVSVSAWSSDCNRFPTGQRWGVEMTIRNLMSWESMDEEIDGVP